MNFIHKIVCFSLFFCGQTTMYGAQAGALSFDVLFPPTPYSLMLSLTMQMLGDLEGIESFEQDNHEIVQDLIMGRLVRLTTLADTFCLSCRQTVMISDGDIDYMMRLLERLQVACTNFVKIPELNAVVEQLLANMQGKLAGIGTGYSNATTPLLVPANIAPETPIALIQ